MGVIFGRKISSVEEGDIVNLASEEKLKKPFHSISEFSCFLRPVRGAVDRDESFND